MQDFKDLNHAQQRLLEKRYGDVRDVFRRRSEETGLELSLRSNVMREITDPERIDRHFKRYDGTVIGLAVRNIRTLANLYGIRPNGKFREAHVVWMFGETENTISKEQDFFYEIGAIRDEDDTTFDKIPNRIFEQLYKDPAVLAKMNEVLVTSYIDALEFHDWRFIPKGIVVAGTNFLASVHQFHMRHFGNDALGLEIGMGLIEDIITRKDEDVDALRKIVSPILTHEMVHMQILHTGETHAYAIEMLLINQEDDSEIGALKDGLEIVKTNLGKGLGLSLNDYYSQVYKGMVIAIDQFAKHNGEIAELFRNDKTRYKVDSVLAAISMIRESDTRAAKEDGFVDRILALDDTRIEEAFAAARILG